MGKKETMYLTIKKDFFEEHKDKALERGKEDFGDEFEEYMLELKLHIDETYEEDECLHLSALLNDVDGEFGYISANIPIPFEVIIQFIETYRKKLGKLKTVMEAIKD